MTDRYDIVFTVDGASLQLHFCRDWDESGGCYGTNPDHGLSLDDACEEIAKWHEVQAKAYRDKTHISLLF